MNCLVKYASMGKDREKEEDEIQVRLLLDFE